MEIIVFAVLVSLGYFFGRGIEKSHFEDLIRREKASLAFPIHSGKRLPEGATACFVVARSVVISDDYFKKVSAGLKSIIGGRLTAYETLLDRARREATLRMKEEAMKLGARGVVHFRLESERIFGEEQTGAMGVVQVTAYGTAYK